MISTILPENLVSLLSEKCDSWSFAEKRIDQIDEQQYREMLPKFFEPHEIPQSSLFVADYIKVYPLPMTRCQEGAVSLNCRYGEE